MTTVSWGVVKVSGPTRRVTELRHLALRPPGIVAICTLLLDIAAFVVLFGFRVAFVLMLVALIATVVTTVCIVRGMRE